MFLHRIGILACGVPETDPGSVCPEFRGQGLPPVKAAKVLQIKEINGRGEAFAVNESEPEMDTAH